MPRPSKSRPELPRPRPSTALAGSGGPRAPVWFSQPQLVPQAIAHAELLCATPLDVQTFTRTAVGAAVRRLCSKRLKASVLGPVPLEEQNSRLRERWRELLKKTYVAQASAMVWLRDDVIVDDYHLIERLGEAWTQQDMVVIRDKRGQVVLWALSRRAVRRWLDRGAPAPAETARKQAPEPFRHDGAFPDSELKDALTLGIRSGPWPLSLSLAPESTVMEDLRLSLNPGEPLFDDRRIVQPAPLLVVCATREVDGPAFAQTPTGRSITRLRAAGVNIVVKASLDNKAALAKFYNDAIKPELRDHIALFIHDDVWIDDGFIAQHLHEGLLRYDVIGVAGNRNRASHQPAWAFPEKVGKWDEGSNLLGGVAHDAKARKGRASEGDAVSRYGAARGGARLLDGVLIAARVRTLLDSGARFDERFPFHFYDLDFCRNSEQRGLRIGVWPLAITHMSGGAGGYRSAEWHACWGRYIGKWGG